MRPHQHLWVWGACIDLNQACVSAGDRKLDEGSFGTIETAFYFGSKVAIKYLKIEAAQGNMHISLPQALHQLRLELSIVQTLRHPNIVDFIGAVVSFPDVSKCGGTTNEDWSIGTMYEFCEGGQLNRLLHKTRVKLSTAQKMKLLTDLANGLSYLHANRIIHRDLGSRNVLIRYPSNALHFVLIWLLLNSSSVCGLESLHECFGAALISRIIAEISHFDACMETLATAWLKSATLVARGK